MQNLSPAFTMIELIFVIVILGILAGVAIPKISATRNDAFISKTAYNIMLGATEIASYATAQGVTDANFKVMSNAMSALENDGAVLSSSQAIITMGGVSACVTIAVSSGVNDENLTISFGSAGGDSRCLSLQSAIDA